ncbi:hypothetical protein [Methanospirillum lacunae]|uniref:PAS domain-containing protein n=1 Tax=Methanospirillum lacunae TaxID=668570 RepID=A0A2V2MQ76_9EURY|nr:hypothetical protein [Methanospirillum lacunae]PWR70262.1 hypothetical protein DK846_15210 [Methanospirillum lacunae]
MKISDEEIVLIMSVFKNNLQGLSISEISRKSCIHRNKVAQISQDLHNDGIITCTQKGSSKIYSLKVRSSIHPLLEVLTDPWLILDNEFRIIEASEAFLEKNRVELTKILGNNYFEITDNLTLPFRQEDLLQIMNSQIEGEKKIYDTKNGYERYSCLQISFNGEMRGILIVIQAHHGEVKTDQNINTLCKTLESMLDNLTKIVQKPPEEISSLIAEIIHNTYPENIVCTIRIDESELSGHITKILLPHSRLQRVHYLIDFLQKTPFQIPPLTLMRYKTGKPYLFEDISVFLENVLNQQELENIRDIFQFYSVFLIGLLQNEKLAEIFVIGVKTENIQPEVFSKLLHLISHLFFAAGLFEEKNRALQENINNYQSHYKEIYNLLSQKTKEEKIHTMNENHMKNILFMVMDMQKIPVMITNRCGTIIDLNQTGEEIFKSYRMALMSNPSIQDIFNHEISEAMMKLIENEGDLSDINNHELGIQDTSHAVPLIWHLVKNRSASIQDFFIFVAESLPGSLIQYLKDRGL